MAVRELGRRFRDVQCGHAGGDGFVLGRRVLRVLRLSWCNSASFTKRDGLRFRFAQSRAQMTLDEADRSSGLASEGGER